MLALCHAPRTRRVFALGYLAGLVHYFSSLYWVLHIPYPPGAICGWLALCTYCALYPALWVWICWKLFPATDIAGLTEAWLRLRRMDWRDRVLWPLQCALAWVALECLRGWLFTGFPWNYLANSQLDITPLALFASIGGVLGVSFVVAWCSIGLLVATTGSIHLKGGSRYIRIAKDFGPALGLLVAAITSAWLYTESREKQLVSRGTIRIAMVQPSIPQQVIFNSLGNDGDATQQRLEKLVALTLEANQTQPDLIVWPEASAPFGVIRLQEGRIVTRDAGRIAEVLGTPMVIGSDEKVGVLNGERFEVQMNRNSCFYFDQNSTPQAGYSKRHLVMFGEYVPLGDMLPFLRQLAPVGTFTPGDGPAVFDLGKAKAAPIICFEDVVPELVRQTAVEEVDFLLNLTNDGWFGESNQQWQHARTAAFRAIETGRPLVRCTNNGLTCWVDRYGRIHRLEEGSEYAPGVRVVDLPLHDHTGRRTTIYQRTGDVTGWVSVLAVMLMLGLRWRTKKVSAEEPDMA